MKSAKYLRILCAGLAAVLLLGALVLPVQAQDPTTATAIAQSKSKRREQRAAAKAVVRAEKVKVEEIPLEAAGREQLRFNFKGVPLDTVLDYLSEAAGFVIVKSVEVDGRVDVVSHQALTREEAVALLNTVLNEKGYAAIRKDRTLTIVSRDEARQRDIPVRTGNDPTAIAKSDEMVTQIIPVKYTNAADLVTSIKELLPEYATLSANTGSNALVLTGTQTDIRRITEIVQALDQSISAISALRVFKLKYADATETAQLIQGIFQIDLTGRSSSNDPRAQIQQMFSRMGGGSPMFFGGGDRGGGDRGGRSLASGGSSGGDSTALKVASRVAAAADARTNSLVVSAPEEFIQNIEELVAEIDQPTDVLTVVQVFTLQYADAEEMAEVINDIYGEEGQAGQAQSGRSPMGFPFMAMMSGRSSGGSRGGSSNLSSRQMEENTVLAVADTRTNSVIVSAASEMMDQVAQTVQELDQNPAKSKKVHVYSLKNAKPEEVTDLLQDMFGSETSGGNRSGGNRNNNNNRNNQSGNRNNRNGSNQRSGGSRNGSGSFGGSGGIGGR